MTKLDEIQHYKEMVPSPHIRGVDLITKKQVALTIKEVNPAYAFKGDKGIDQVKPAVNFEETDKVLILCSTNLASIARLHGNRPKDWRGKQITLKHARVDFGKKGNKVDAVRIKE